MCSSDSVRSGRGMSLVAHVVEGDGLSRAFRARDVERRSVGGLGCRASPTCPPSAIVGVPAPCLSDAPFGGRYLQNMRRNYAILDLF